MFNHTEVLNLSVCLHTIMYQTTWKLFSSEGKTAVMNLRCFSCNFDLCSKGVGSEGYRESNDPFYFPQKLKIMTDVCNLSSNIVWILMFSRVKPVHCLLLSFIVLFYYWNKITFKSFYGFILNFCRYSLIYS